MSDKVDYDEVIDRKLETREFPSLDQISDPEEQAQALLQDALCRLIDVHYLLPGDAGEPRRSDDMTVVVQALAVAARLPLLARITQLEGRVEALERQLNHGAMIKKEAENGR
jgi:hypothetical protein